MENQKIDALLNLAQDASQEELEKSEVLEVGYDSAQRAWQVIVRYHGELQPAAETGWRITELSGGFAVIELPRGDLERLAALPQIEYVEKPKRLYFSVDQGRAASCVSAVQSGIPNSSGADLALFGRGILMAVIDSGVDYFHPDFRNADGTTRIRYLWDQTTGMEYSASQINEALAAGSRSEGLRLVSEQDFSGHGTEVLGIAAGNGQASGGRYRGMAPESDLIVVKMGVSDPEGFPRTTELMKALDYVSKKADRLSQPIAINLSFGTVYGSHRGDSLLESYISQIADRGKTVICIGTGNEGNADGHASGKIRQNASEEIEFLIDNFQTQLNIQLWKNYADEFEIQLTAPDGRSFGPLSREMGTARYRLANETLLVYYGEPSPYQLTQEIFFDFIPNTAFLTAGIWRIQLIPRRIITGEYDLWLNEARERSGATRFLKPSPDTTLTIPSTAENIIAVGAYDSKRNIYAPFSGRGRADGRLRIRPDLVAPGVSITTTAPGGGYTSVSGTSFATPFVTGAAALLMQWGIVDGNDPYLYGEKVRAYLQKGARQLPGFTQWPNNLVGYGALCVKNSLPMI